MAAGSIVVSSATSSPAFSTIGPRVYGCRPSPVMRSSKLPGGRSKKRKTPSALETARWLSPVVMLRSSTTAPAAPRPDGSAITPSRTAVRAGACRGRRCVGCWAGCGDVGTLFAPAGLAHTLAPLVSNNKTAHPECVREVLRICITLKSKTIAPTREPAAHSEHQHTNPGKTFHHGLQQVQCKPSVTSLQRFSQTALSRACCCDR